MNPTLKKNIIVHSSIIAGFLLVTLLVFYPSLLGNKSLNQHDILESFGADQQLREYRSETNIEPLWNPYLFSGMPAYLAGVRYTNVLTYVYRVLTLNLGHPEGILFVSFVGFYILLLSFKVRPFVAAIGALAFGLNGFNMIGIMAGHNAKIAAVALMPLVLAGIHYAFSGKRWVGFGLTALAVGLELQANHLQITYYLIFIVGAYGIYQLAMALKSKNMKEFGITSGVLILAAVLAFGSNFARISTILEYSPYTIRGKSELSSDQKESSGLDKEYAFRYSNGIAEPLFLFVPNIFGGSSQQPLSQKSAVAEALGNAGYNRQQIAQQIQAMPTYWGSQPLTAPYFAGTLTVVLFILGIFLLEKKHRAWLIPLVVVGIVLSWGKNFEGFNNFLFEYLPGYNKFRSVTFTIIISIFAMNLMAWMTLEKIIASDWNAEARKKTLLGVGISGGFLLALVVFAGILGYRGAVDAQMPDWIIDALRSDRESLLRKDALRALMFVTGFSIIVWSIMKKRVKTQAAILGVLALVLVDNVSLTKRFLNEDRFQKSPSKTKFEPTQADQQLMRLEAPGDRVLNLQNPFNENRTSYYHASIGGYHGAKLRRYQDLIDYCLHNELQSAYDALRSQSLDFSNLQILNMLNTRFFYAGIQANGVFPNQSANGPAWIVNDVVAVSSPDEEIGAVCSLDTKTQAVVDQSKFSVPAVSGTGTIQLVEKTPNKIVYQSNASGGNVLGVFSEIYYPEGWSATIDGEEVDIIRANYVLRALEIPSGPHEIVFEFKPSTYLIGKNISMASSVLVLLSFLLSLGLQLRNKNEV